MICPEITTTRSVYITTSHTHIPLLGVNGHSSSRFTLVTSFTSKRSEWLKSECINIFDGKVYQLALEQTAHLDKVIPRTYAHVLYLYTKHPEAKSLAPDGTPCVCDTRGLLQRSSVVVASRRYVGKETDRRWEQGEDLSLVEFTSFEYQQSKQVVASEDIKQDILKSGIRKLERVTGVSHHTLDKILKGEHVRRRTLRSPDKFNSIEKWRKSQPGADRTSTKSFLTDELHIPAPWSSS